MVMFPMLHFNPRSPWGERLSFFVVHVVQMSFQSTLPVGGATTLDKRDVQLFIFQSTLPVGGATVKE